MTSRLALLVAGLVPALQAAPVAITWSGAISPNTMTVYADQNLTFEWSGTHDVAMAASQTAYTDCTTPPTASNLGGTSPVAVPIGHASRNGTVYYICTISGHCAGGQKIAITFSSDDAPTPTPAPTPAPTATPAASGATSKALSMTALLTTMVAGLWA